MTMNGKVTIIAAILKRDKPFRVPQIQDLTGLSRQLIHHHVTQFVKDGLLEKNGRYYAILDNEKLLDAMVNTDESKSVRMLAGSYFFNRSKDLSNNLAKLVVAMRVLRLPQHNEARLALIDEIDGAISQLKNLKKFVNEKSYTERRAFNTLVDELEATPESVFKHPMFKLEETMSYHDFKEEWVSALELAQEKWEKK